MVLLKSVRCGSLWTGLAMLGLFVTTGCGGGGRDASAGASPAPVGTGTVSQAGRGFSSAAPWASCYGSATKMGSLDKAAATFRILNIDADPGTSGFTPAQIAQLKNGGKNRVISYLNVGSCESFRSYWQSVPAGFLPAKTFALGPYSGYPDEQWMDLSNADYQNLIVNYVAPRLAVQGVDGFFLDNMELVEHGPNDTNGPCSPACRQGGLDLVRKLREKYPSLLIVMQNATSDVTRLGTTGGIAFPTLLDGISHEEVYQPTYDAEAETQLLAWKSMALKPGGRPFWIGTEDYVGSASNTQAAQNAYTRSRGRGFSPYAADDSGKQQTIFYWPF